MPEHPSKVRTVEFKAPAYNKSAASDVKPHRSLFERLTALISPEPESRAKLGPFKHTGPPCGFTTSKKPTWQKKNYDHGTKVF